MNCCKKLEKYLIKGLAIYEKPKIGGTWSLGLSAKDKDAFPEVLPMYYCPFCGAKLEEET